MLETFCNNFVMPEIWVTTLMAVIMVMFVAYSAHTERKLRKRLNELMKAKTLDDKCDFDLIGFHCRCPACEMRKVEAAEFAQDGSEGR